MESSEAATLTVAELLPKLLKAIQSKDNQQVSTLAQRVRELDSSESTALKAQIVSLVKQRDFAAAL